MSENSVIQMYGTADTDSSATIDVPDDGVLLSTYLNMMTTGQAADGDYSAMQLSFGSVSQFTTNDARGVLAHCGISADLGGAAANVFLNMNHSNIEYGDGIKVFGGERLFIHVVSAGNATVTRWVALLVFNFKSFVQRRR